jgi:serine/threonine protein kinase
MDIGAVINQQYQVIEHIGRGGMADVWSARDTRLRRMVAIKTIASGLGTDVDPVNLFKREAHTIAQMEHPHILPIYDFGEHDNSLYIVMRYMTAGSLEDLLRAGPMSPEEVLRLGEAVGQALDYAHSNNVIHLDLKPPNILLDSSKSPYLADFGLATALDPEGRANNPGSGTLLYMAPEQLVAETLDHRADIYAFCIMLFHMFTGRLPFDGTVPLALQQVQRGEEMPHVDDYVSYLPSDLTTILRVGTANDPLLRPETHMDIMQQVRSILQPSSLNVISGDDFTFEGESDTYNLPTQPYEGISDSDLLEAVDIYSRARYNWQGGQGRFLLGVTHFMLMSEYYQNAKQHGLSIDQYGYQMLLRGALEYDHELKYWWGKVNEDDRRWVCLHALRSGNSPARIRALYRLETLPDEEGTGVIPRLVAQALEIETDEAAKIAALTVLGTRARLMKPRPRMQIMTEYRGRLITTMTRLGIELAASGEWQEVVYSKDVDLLVAEQAFDPLQKVADFAARTVGKMRSLAAVTHLSAQQENGRAGALRALALVRDEAPSLPDVVNREARFYAWITNTVRRLSENPLETVLRFAIVFLAGWIGMGSYIYAFFRVAVGSLINQRWANTLGMGITFGVLLGLTYILSAEVSRRLKGFWPWWMRLLVAGLLGYIMASISYASYRFLFLAEPVVSLAWDEMRFAGAALAFGVIGAQLLDLKAWQSLVFTVAVAFMPIIVTFHAYYFPDTFTILPIAVYMLLIGVFCGWRVSQLVPDAPITDEKPKRRISVKPDILMILLAAAAGLLWAASLWGFSLSYYEPVLLGEGFAWDIVLWLSIASVAIGTAFSYWLKQYRYVFVLVALIVFVGLYALHSWRFFDYSFVLPLSQPSFNVSIYEGTPLRPVTDQPIINYDREGLWDILHVSLPMFVVMALGLHFREVLASWSNWIGKPRTPKERGAWLSLSLIYVMVITTLVSLLALFASGQNRLWELAWSGWAFMTFVFALATFHWAKWGARGLLFSGIFLLVGALAYDGMVMYREAQAATWPVFLSVIPIQIPFTDIVINAPQLFFWGAWAVVLGIFVWGALRRELWAGIGLIVMLVAWFVVAVASPVMGSIAVFAITNVALICYALSAKYELMETNRWRLASQTVVETSPSTSSPVGMETQLISPTDEAPVPPTQLIVMEDEQAKQPSTSEMLTEKDPLSHGYELETEEQNNSMATTIAIDIDMSTAAQIVIDEDMLRTQLPPPQVDLNTQLPPSDAPKISIDTSTLRSKPAPKEPPVIKLDLGDIRNQRTVRLSGDAPKPSPSDEEKPED